MKKRFPFLAVLMVLTISSFTPLLTPVASAATTGDKKTNVVSNALSYGFNKPAFQKVWNRTDQLVDSGAVGRSYLWGPTVEAGNGLYAEFYDDSPNNYRWVQYFDKTRMEINNYYANPNGDFYVSNGLLVIELISGVQKDGDTRTKTLAPANTVPVAGDPDPTANPAPTYASFLGVASLDNDTNASRRVPDRTAQRVTATINREGIVGSDANLGNTTGVDLVYYENTLGHNIPRALWDYLNQTGPVIGPDGKTVVNGGKVFNWVSAMGFPIAEAYWTKATVAGVQKDVLVQPFQRRILTYTPSNPKEFQVEMGNVGQHYFRWRYSATGARNYIPPRDVPLKTPQVSYGVNAHLYYNARENAINSLKDVGARWVRQQVTWSDIEASPGVYVWDELDKIVEALYVNNFHILISPVGTPSFYQKAGFGKIPADANKFGDFMAAMSKRYATRVDAYEMWNEPNLAGEVGAPISVQRYVGLLAKGSGAVKVNDPYAYVISGAPSPTGINDPNVAIDDVEYLKQLYAYNNGEVRKANYFDALGTHPGSNSNPPDTLWPSKPGPGPGYIDHPSFYFRRIEGVRDVMVAAGDSNRQIWLTEFGWASSPNPAPGYEYAKQISDDQQAAYIKGAYEFAKAQYPYMGVMALWNLNFALPTVTNSANDEKVAWGIIRRDGSLRPSYNAFKALATAVP